MPSAGFKAVTPAIKRLQAYALHRTAIMIVMSLLLFRIRCDIINVESKPNYNSRSL